MWNEGHEEIKPQIHTNYLLNEADMETQDHEN